MKVVFAGPSLHGVEPDLTGIDLRPPAAHGDLHCAALEGAAVIGLIDGAFEAVASVWHKEILEALSAGIAVVGGASMGALRAAECAAFGMEPVGAIARAYLDGSSDDDAAVAITHGPFELGSPPLVEALVDSEATIAAMARAGVLGEDAARRALGAARSIHYKDRTVSHLASLAWPDDRRSFAALYLAHRVSLKTLDALAVLERVRQLPARRSSVRPRWLLNRCVMWREASRRIAAARTAP